MSRFRFTIDVDLDTDELAEVVDDNTPPYSADPRAWDHLEDITNALGLLGIEEHTSSIEGVESL